MQAGPDVFRPLATVGACRIPEAVGEGGNLREIAQSAFGGAFIRWPDGWRYFGSGYLVPGAIDLPDGKMWAPEIDWEALMDVETAARFLGVEPVTLRGYLRASTIVEPQVWVGRQPAWSRQVLRQWQRSRPAKGSRKRSAV